MENILFGLVPAMMWGIQPIVMTKLGGKSTKKVIGMALGIFITSIIVYFFRRPENWTMSLILLSFIDGLALSYGLINQIKGFNLLGVSKGTPISTGTQLVGATLIGAIFFKEWQTLNQYILGIIALIMIILGVSMTAFQENKTDTNNSDIKKGVITMILSSIGFIMYTVILKVADINIWDALIPQGLGMLVGSIILARREDKEKLFVKESYKHIITGFIFAAANITLMISNIINGLALGFTLTQMNVVVATIGGLIILKENKTKKELSFTIIGLFLVIIGAILIGLTK